MNLIDLDELNAAIIKIFDQRINESVNYHSAIHWQDLFKIIAELQTKAKLRQDFEDSH